jgi:putative transcriptional regulator
MRQYRTKLMASIHETAKGLHDAGVTDKQSMHKFDEACLTPVRPLTGEEIGEREGDDCGKLQGASARSSADQSS